MAVFWLSMLGFQGVCCWYLTIQISNFNFWKGNLELLLLFNQVETKFLLSLLSRDSCYYRSCYYLVVAETEQPGSILLKFQPGREFQAGSLPSILRDIKNNPKQDSKNPAFEGTQPIPSMYGILTYIYHIYIYVYKWMVWARQHTFPPSRRTTDPIPSRECRTPLQLASTSSSFSSWWIHGGDMGQLRYGGLIGILIMVYYTPYISLG